MAARSRIETVAVAGAQARIRVIEAAGRGAPWILALHGFTGCGEDFAPLRAAIGEPAANWICPDWMGHGLSDSPALLDPYLLPNALALVDGARGLAGNPESVCLLAYSMGGRLALHYLLWARPLPALLIGASPGLDNIRERAARRTSDRDRMRASKGSIEAFCDAWEQQPLIAPQTRLPAPLAHELARRRRQNRLAGLENSLLACGAGALPSLWDRLPELPPVTLVHGEQDARFAGIAAAMARRNPAFPVRSIPASGHAPHLEQPALLARLVRDWMRTSGR
jgi:2-succinyl-6-hydroxy-2,4-cyclohexadiene-1-carboxylate synthase